MSTGSVVPPISSAVGPVPNLRGHMPALDGLRGLAILMVMFHHFTDTHDAHHSLLSKVIFQLGAFGWTGVDLFFVLSGFLITGILYDSKGGPRFFRNFYARRSLRIFPLYYGVLFVLFVLIPLIRPFGAADMQDVAHRQGWLWTYCPNLLITWWNDWPFEAGWLRLNNFWSLAVEEHFYLLWPAVVFFFERKTLMRIAGVCMVAGLAVKVALWHAGGPGEHPHNELGIYTFTFSRIDVLACGCFLALYARGGGDAFAKLRKVAAAGLPVSCGLLVACQYVDPPMTGRFTGTAGYTIIAGFFASLLVLSVGARASGLWGGFLQSRVMTFFGKYSYGLYVFNSVLGVFFERMRSRFISSHIHSYPLAMAAYILAAGGLSVAAACLSWHLYEKHFLKLKRFFETRKPAAAASPDAGDAAHPAVFPLRPSSVN